MTTKNLRWLALLASATLAACGGGSESTQDATIKAATILSASHSVASSDQAVRFNKADALTVSPPDSKRGGADAFQAVSVDVKASRESAARIDLGAPAAADLDQVRKNNARRSGPLRPRAYQTGFSRPVDAASQTKSFQQLLLWRSTDNGVLRATIRLSSAGAKALRIGLEVRALPDDAVLRVFADGGATAQQTSGAHINERVRANVTADGDSADARTYWLPATLGEATVLEVDLPAGSDPSSLGLAIPRLIHQVENAVEAKVGDLQAKSACPNLTPDATCTLPPAANAVTRIDFVDGVTPKLCSGTLVANRGAAQEGYVLTADHCINTQTAASSVTTYWFYRSNTCNSADINPNWTSLPGGASLRFHRSAISSYAVRNGALVITVDGTDTSLIDLIGTPPTGAMFAGWAFQRHSIGATTNYTSLHHPLGNWLRRSDGKLSNYAYDSISAFDVSSDPQFPLYEVDWTSGITEAGSSGSGLFQDVDTSNPKIIGQLYGGFSACDAPTGNDYYGRFDLGYEDGMIDWLNPGYRMVFRFYNTGNGAHFFSANVAERDAARINNPALTYEAPVYMVSPSGGTGLTPVYRFYNRFLGVHFYTNSEAEKANVLANLSGTYTYEGVAWYAPPAGSTIAATVDVFRFFRLGVGTHLYTASVAERDNIIANLGQYYTYEGVAYKAWPLN